VSIKCILVSSCDLGRHSGPIEAEVKLTAQTDIVVVVQLVNSLDLATNVQLLNSLVQVDDSGVLLVTTEDKLTLLLPKSGGKEYVSVQTH
jgi:hypothetical protein